MKKIGILTIGQSPRTDLTDDLDQILENVELVEKGALDDFTLAQVKGEFSPK